MNISINDNPKGKLIFEVIIINIKLFENINPKTTENFKVLA